MTSPASESKTLLLGFINRGKELADEIRALQADTTDVCKEAKGAGFDPVKIREVVRWLVKIDKHGRGKVDEAEAIFDLYRQVADPEAKPLSAMMPDEREVDALAQHHLEPGAGDLLAPARGHLRHDGPVRTLDAHHRVVGSDRVRRCGVAEAMRWWPARRRPRCRLARARCRGRDVSLRPQGA